MNSSSASSPKQVIADRLAAFADGPLAENAVALLDALGYRSDKTAPIIPNTAAELLSRYPNEKFRFDKALCEQWQSVDLLFQITDEEISAGGQLAFAAIAEPLNNQIIQSYLFFAIDLKPREGRSNTQHL